MLKRSISIIVSVIFIIGCGGRADTNNSQTDVDPIIVDKTPPVIFDLSDSDHSANSVLVTWKTDERANGIISYGDGPLALINKKFSVSGLVTEHSFAITGLSPVTAYYFQVESCDRNNNCAKSTVESFQTTEIPDTVSPVIDNIMTFSLTYNSAVLSWQTSEPASSEFSYGTSQIDLRNKVIDTEFSVIHVARITGLRENTVYYFQIKACDAAGNCALSSIGSFRTPKQDDGGDDPDPDLP